VESVYGEGSKFSFDLWQKIENEEPLGDYREAIAKPQTTEAERGDRHGSAETNSHHPLQKKSCTFMVRLFFF
ncbi:MAG: hypothetical protein IKZ47_02640, partial [Clostridia bacterium]|nr:hypothetical protein [Clostridia bacterium]